jgi:hypothetical protein
MIAIVRPRFKPRLRSQLYRGNLSCQFLYRITLDSKASLYYRLPISVGVYTNCRSLMFFCPAAGRTFGGAKLRDRLKVQTTI